jgi:hypothetical protein
VDWAAAAAVEFVVDRDLFETVRGHFVACNGFLDFCQTLYHLPAAELIGLVIMAALTPLTAVGGLLSIGRTCWRFCRLARSRARRTRARAQVSGQVRGRQKTIEATPGRPADARAKTPHTPHRKDRHTAHDPEDT